MTMKLLPVFALIMVLFGHVALAEKGSSPASNISDSADLKAMFESAINFSPKLNIAREKWNIGQARYQISRGKLLPQISLRGSFSDNRRTSVDPATNKGILSEYNGEKKLIQLSQILFDWASITARSRASLLEDVSEEEYYVELSGLLVDVAERYLDVLEAEDMLHSIVLESNAVEKQMQQVEQLYKRQLAKVTDYYEVQARVAGVKADLIDAQNSLELSRESLSEITGENINHLHMLDSEINIPQVEGTIAEWQLKANTQNPLYKAKKLGVKAASKLVSEKRGAYLPQLSLVAQHLKSDIGFENTASQDAETTYVGIDVVVPLFAGGASRAGVREAKSQRNIARSELLQVQREITKRTRAAYLSAKSSRVRSEAASQLVKSTEKSSIAMQRGFSFGTVTSVDVLNALRDQYVAQRDLQKTRYLHIKALLALKREAGELTAQDLLEVNSWLKPR